MQYILNYALHDTFQAMSKMDSWAGVAACMHNPSSCSSLGVCGMKSMLCTLSLLRAHHAPQRLKVVLNPQVQAVVAGRQPLNDGLSGSNNLRVEEQSPCCVGQYGKGAAASRARTQLPLSAGRWAGFVTKLRASQSVACTGKQLRGCLAARNNATEFQGCSKTRVQWECGNSKEVRCKSTPTWAHAPG